MFGRQERTVSAHSSHLRPILSSIARLRVVPMLTFQLPCFLKQVVLGGLLSLEHLDTAVMEINRWFTTWPKIQKMSPLIEMHCISTFILPVVSFISLLLNDSRNSLSFLGVMRLRYFERAQFLVVKIQDHL